MTRAATAWICSAALVASSLLPPSHIHLAEHDHDHDHSAVEHAHWSSHGAPSRQALDDDDGQAIYVDHPACATSLATMAPPAAIVISLLIGAVPETFVCNAQREAGNAPRDGPARGPFSLRGPPLVL